MTRSRKLFFSSLFSLLLFTAAPYTAYSAEGWQQEDGNWYYYQDGARIVNQWVQENGDSYYMGPDGKMTTGSGHLIDGYLYDFTSDGKLLTEALGDVWRDHKVTYDGHGKGILSAMDQQDALYGSSCVDWMDQTYAIFTEYRNELEIQANMRFSTLPPIEDMLEHDWGITDREGGTAIINQLFNAGIAAQDKQTKAWNFSRAMMLCGSMREARWIKMEEYRDIQYAMAPTIQQSFTSWEDFFDNYMEAYRQWDAAAGANAIELREAAYESVKKIMAENNEDTWIPWDKPLVKYWQSLT